MLQSLTGKVVLITGASTGIGAAAARALARAGCKVALLARSADKLRALAEELGPAALALPGDVTRDEDVERAVAETVHHFGRIDALLANAGIYQTETYAEGDPRHWANLMDVNVNGVLRSVHCVLPHLLAQGSGDIIVTSSISGFRDLQWEPIYSASKHAIQSIVHTLHHQVAGKGVRVGSIAPGTVANELWGISDPAEIDQRVAEHMALRSEDVANVIVFMLSQPPHVLIHDLVLLPQKLAL